MILRNVFGTRKGKFTQINFTVLDFENPILLHGKKFPINRLNTQALSITDTSASMLDPDGSYYPILTTNTELTVKIDEADEAEAKLKEGFPVVIGDQFFKKQSPAPFAFTGTDGKLNALVLANSIFNDSVMGYAGEGKSDTYAQGLCPAGSSIHRSLFLRKDGRWGSPSVHTGSVSEHLVSLHDFPSEYTGQVDKYLRVSYAEGGSIVFDAINSDKVPEGSGNLYYTDDRVEAKIISKTSDRSLSTLSVIDTITAKEFITDSDRRLKTDVTRIKGGLEVINTLNPVCYKFIGNSDKTHFGLIAQEVEQIIPEIVNNEKECKAINYLELIPFLIDSIQILHQKVRELEKSVSV